MSVQFLSLQEIIRAQDNLQQAERKRSIEYKIEQETKCYDAYVSLFNKQITSSTFPIVFKVYAGPQLQHQQFYEYNSGAWNRFEYELRQRFEIVLHEPALDNAFRSLAVLRLKDGIII